MNDQLVKRLFRSTLAIQVSTVLVTVLGIVVDGIVTGSCLGVDAMASYGLCSPMTYLYGGLAGIFAMGISIPCGKSIGTGDKDATNRIFSQSVLFSLVVGLAVLAITFLAADPIAMALGANDSLRPEAANFLRGYAIAAPAMFFVSEMLPIMQVDGDRNRALAAVSVVTAVNIALVLINGFVLHGGLLFIALSTSLSYYAGSVVLLLHFIQKRGMFRLHLVRFERKVLRDLFAFGTPNALQQTCRGILVICMNQIIRAVTGDSTTALAAYSAINVGSMMFMAVGTGIGQSISIITSIFSGEKDVESITYLLRTALRTTVIVNAALMVFAIFAAPVLMIPFVKGDAATLELAVEGFRLFGLCLVFYGLNVALRAYYQAMRMVKFAYLYVLLDNLACTVAFAFVLGQTFGITGVWMSFVAGEATTLLVFLAAGLLSRRGTGLLGKLMHIAPDFTAGIHSSESWSCSDADQVEAVSQAVHERCSQRGASERTSYLLALTAEEMCLNIVKYGFADGKPHNLDVKLLELDSGWMLRIRDNCELFDPVCYLKVYDDSDPMAHIGIRMISKIADRMEYVSTLKINNLLIAIDNQGGRE